LNFVGNRLIGLIIIMQEPKGRPL